MQSLRIAFVPGLIAGVLSIFTSWLWMGLVFHRFQAETPETWRPEDKRSYAFSILIHLLASIAIATLLVLVAHPADSPFSRGLEHGLAFGFVAWGAIAAPILVGAAVYIRLHPLVVLGQLLDWLSTLLLASGIAAWWCNT